MREIIPQDSPRWLVARRGMLTASRFADVVAVKKDGTPTAAYVDLLYEIAAERITGQAVDRFVSAAMQWGIHNEQGAADAFEVATGIMVDAGGLVMHDRITGFGATPDRLIGDDAILEIKCPNTTTHLRYVSKDRDIWADYGPQVMAQLACTGSRRAFLVSYDPRVPKPQIYISERVFTDDDIRATEDRARAFLADVDTLMKTLQETETWDRPLHLKST